MKSNNYGTLQENLFEKSKHKYRENNPDYKGTEMREELSSGVIRDRSCTDILCLLIFISFWAGMIAIALIASKKGSPDRLASPYDSDGNHCGYDSGFENYKNIYFTDPSTPDNLKNYVCVADCPKNTTHLDCHSNSFVPQCESVKVYDSIKLIHICIPSDPSIWNKIKGSVNLDDISEGIHDLEKTWSLLLGSALIAFVLGLFIMILMKFCAPVLIWGFILLYLGLLIVSGCLFYFNSKGLYEIESLDFIEKEISNKNNVLLGLSITLWVIAVISFLLIICFVNRIRLAIAIMEESANYIRSVTQTFVVPIAMFIISCGFFAFWFYVTLHLYSAGEFSKRGSTPFAHVAWDDTIKKLISYYIIALIWNIEFLIGLTQLILAFGVSYWYFSQGIEKNLHGIIRTSVWTTIRYHLGSVALASFVLTLVWIIRIAFEIFYRQLKNSAQEHTNGCLNFCYKCVHCCLDCFERFIRFLNKKSYIQIAITGEGFFTSAYESFYLVLRNAGRFAALDTVGTIIMFFGKLFIAGFSALICYLIIIKVHYFKDNIYSPVVPTIFCFLIAYLIGAFFMSVYSIAADTILQCFCIDEEVHKTHKNLPAQYCPETLKTFIDKNT